jgi:arginine exporter protein ArgO
MQLKDAFMVLLFLTCHMEGKIVAIIDAFLRGIFAGYGIAIPVGPIAILIIELGIRRGFTTAFCAGAGAASADLIYATIAVVAGTILVSILAPFSGILHTASACGLILIGVWLLYRGFQHSHAQENRLAISSEGYSRIYTMVLGLTLLNPVTVTYFTTLILGLKATTSESPLSSFLFVAGAYLASLSWQTLLAIVSGLAHRRFPQVVQTATFAVGNLMIIAIGIAMLVGLI